MMLHLAKHIFLLSLLQLASQTPARAGSIAVDLRLLPEHGLYYAPMKIGEREFKLLVSSVTDEIVMISDDQLVFKTGQGVFRAGLTSTGNGLRSELAECFLREILLSGQDIGRQRVTVLRHSSTTGGTEFAALGIDGLLGFDNSPTGLSNYRSFVESLSAQKRIGRNLVSLYLNSSCSSELADCAAGKLIFGGIDEQLYDGELEYVALQAEGPEGWIRSLDSVELDWSRARSSPGVRAPTSEKIEFEFFKDRLRFDSSSHLHVGPAKILNKFLIEHMRAKLMGQKEGVYVLSDCSLDNKPDFVFRLRQFELRVEPHDYVVRLADGANEVCIAAFKGTQTAQFSLGTRVMRKYYLVFDYENKRFGWAKARL